jgi:hypothetical protein
MTQVPWAIPTLCWFLSSPGMIFSKALVKRKDFYLILGHCRMFKKLALTIIMIFEIIF